MLKIFLVSLLFIPIGGFSQNTIVNTGSKVTPEDAKAILDFHNKVRGDLHISELNWSTKLAAYAQAWADFLASSNNCKLRHRANPGENGEAYGENIFEGSSSESYKPIDAALAWYGEKQNYTYRKIDESSWSSTGHYTQMVWKDTKEVGVGVATCANGALIVVANYYPAGNFMGAYPY